MARKKRSASQKGALQRVLDNEGTQVAQGYLNVLTDAQKASGEYANSNGGRRYFRLTPLDRLRRNGKITYQQHKAGERYRELWDIGRYDRCQTMSVNDLPSPNVVSFDMPTRRQDARDAWRAARKEIRTRDTRFADSILLENNWPSVGDRARVRRLKRIRSVLDTLVVHFRIR